jgi:hypothetical protein
VVQPTPQQDTGDYGQVYQALAKGVQDDLANSLIAGLETRDNVRVDQKLFARVYQ